MSPQMPQEGHWLPAGATNRVEPALTHTGAISGPQEPISSREEEARR